MDQFRRKDDLRREVLNQLDKLQQQRLTTAMESWQHFFSQQPIITNNNQNGRKH